MTAVPDEGQHPEMSSLAFQVQSPYLHPCGPASSTCGLSPGVPIRALPPTASSNQSPRKHKALDKTSFCDTEKEETDRAISASIVGLHLLWPGSLRAAEEGSGPARTPRAAPESPVPFSQGADRAVGLPRCHLTHGSQQSKRAHVEYETEKGVPDKVTGPV